ncbi:MAG: hybrid sensor histidine kinase/response regulator [Leptospira sp.]|nr:hybrid sensor histidine kinase/response regulator [Leptospira sp.]
MFIEDPEFRELFQTDTLEHIQNIETGLIELEKNPKDLETLKNLFREAHSMKGAAGLLGLKDIEAITHVLEDQLGKASKGVTEYNPENADRILYALDHLRILVDEIVLGKKTTVDLKKVIETLTGQIQLETSKKPLVESEEESLRAQVKVEGISSTSIETTSSGMSTVKESSAELAPTLKQSASNTSSAPIRSKVEMMRVDPSKLDLLLGHSGELTVAKNRIQRRAEDITELALTAEENGKNWNDIKQQITNFLRAAKDHGLATSQIDSIKNLLQEEKKKWDQCIENLTTLKVKSIQDSTKLSALAQKLEEGIQNVRLLPLSSVFEIFPRTVRDISRELSKEVFLTLDGGHITVDKLVIEEMKDPLMHLIRNSLDHGIETREERLSSGKSNPAKIRIAGKMVNQMVVVEIEDDGRGIDTDQIKEKAISKGLYTREELESFSTEMVQQIIFHAGFSTKQSVTSLSGRGVGMDVVKTFVERFKGSIEIESVLGVGTRFILKLPINFSTNHALIVQSEGWKFSIPTEFVEQGLFLERDQIQFMEGKPVYNWQNRPIRLLAWRDLFPSPKPLFRQDEKEIKDVCLILNYNGERLALIVDKILDKQEILLKPFSGLVQTIPMMSGTTILESGEICYMVQVSEIFLNVRSNHVSKVLSFKNQDQKNKKKILLAEDSLVTRARLQSLLEESGYEVITAVDGDDALKKFNKTNFDLLLTDVEMPKMDGLELIRDIRKNSQYNNFPIIVLTSLGSEEQIQKGKLVGASAYLVKSQFDNRNLLQTVERLLVDL